MTPPPLPASLQQLARLYGLQTEYVEMNGRLQAAEPASLYPVLRSLGAPLRGPKDIPRAVRLRQKELWSRWVEPVTVVWQGKKPALRLRLPEEKSSGRLEWALELESGKQRRGTAALDRIPAGRTARIAGSRYVVKTIPLPAPLPPGYHPLHLRLGRRTARTLLLSSPLKGYPLFGSRTRKGWGLFAPPYAVCSSRSWGGGDLTDLEDFAEWAAEAGAKVVATLPLFPLFLGRRFEPSPYAPVSRLFWNEFWLDVTRLPEWTRCDSARRLAGSSAFQRKLKALRAAPLVDYRRQMECKRRVLERMAGCFFKEGGERDSGFRDFLRRRPEAVRFARFRAEAEPAGRLRPQGERYHLYAQWAADRQMGALWDGCRRRGVSLYLDFPLGVHPQGYDAQRWKDLFVQGTSTGAPPDSLFTGGQDWGFPPVHPDSIRQHGYRYFRECLAHSMRLSGLLRIDHVMGFHRLFWVPRGFRPAQGVYVRYPAQEWYAVLALESQRHRCAVVGENLGTVPPEVRAALRRHGLLGMFVVQYELQPRAVPPLPEIPKMSVASLNTHDMPPFAAFWKARDRRARAALTGWLRSRGRWTTVRTGQPEALRACLRWLAAGRSRLIQISPEDLWGETKPQNLPGTGAERPNWRRKWRYPLERLKTRAALRRILQEVDSLRHHD